jgi:hypothetical protein
MRSKEGEKIQQQSSVVSLQPDLLGRFTFTLKLQPCQFYSLALLGFIFFISAAMTGSGLSVAGSGLSVRLRGNGERLACPAPPLLDFLEIGTSDFRNLLLEVAADASRGTPKELLRRGVSVDVMAIYLDAMPTLPADVHRKLNVAVVGHEPHANSVEVFYIRPEDLAPNGLPDYLRGCNRVGEPHPLQLWELGVAQKQDLLRTATVPVMSVQTLLQRTGACRVGMFKVDVEGLDGSVLLAFVDFLWAHHECWADFVTFEKKMIDQSHEDAEVRRVGYSKLEAAAAALSSVGYHSSAIINLGEDSDETTFVYDAAFDARSWAAKSKTPLSKEQSDELLAAGHANYNQHSLFNSLLYAETPQGSQSNFTTYPNVLPILARQRRGLESCVMPTKAGDPSPFASQ